jgi:hypothetical protein
LLVVVSDQPSVATLVAVEGSLLALVTGSEWAVTRSKRTLAALAVTWIVLMTALWLALEWTTSVLSTAIALATAVALGAYFLHRYGLVALGLVEVDDE